MRGAGRDGEGHLLFVSVPLYGHLGPLLVQAAEMRRRGWRVTVASTEEARGAMAGRPDLEFLSLGAVATDPVEVEALLARVSAEPDFVKGLMLILDALGATWTVMYDGLIAALPEVKPDLMVVDLASTAGLDAAEAGGVPFVVNNADLLTVLPGGLLPYDPHLPPLLSGRSVHSRSRVGRALMPLRRVAELGGARLTAGRRQNALRRSRGLPPIDFHRRLEGHLILVNSAFGLEYPRSLPPLIQMVGPMLEDSPGEIGEELSAWLADGEPVAVVSFGTVSSPSAELLHRVLDGLRSDGFRALWGLRRDSIPLLPASLPPNVRVESWLPPIPAVLAHPNVRAFVSHCGTNSVQQSILAGVPVVGIPLFGVQGDMAVRIEDASVGVHLRKDRFTPAELRGAVEGVLADARYRENLPAIQRSLRLAGGASRAADLLEMAVTEGVDHLAPGWGQVTGIR